MDKILVENNKNNNYNTNNFSPNEAANMFRKTDTYESIINNIQKKMITTEITFEENKGNIAKEKEKYINKDNDKEEGNFFSEENQKTKHEKINLFSKNEVSESSVIVFDKKNFKKESKEEVIEYKESNVNKSAIIFQQSRDKSLQANEGFNNLNDYIIKPNTDNYNKTIKHSISLNLYTNHDHSEDFNKNLLKNKAKETLRNSPCSITNLSKIEENNFAIKNDVYIKILNNYRKNNNSFKSLNNTHKSNKKPPKKKKISPLNSISLFNKLKIKKQVNSNQKPRIHQTFFPEKTNDMYNFHNTNTNTNTNHNNTDFSLADIISLPKGNKRNSIMASNSNNIKGYINNHSEFLSTENLKIINNNNINNNYNIDQERRNIKVLANKKILSNSKIENMKYNINDSTSINIKNTKPNYPHTPNNQSITQNLVKSSEIFISNSKLTQEKETLLNKFKKNLQGSNKNISCCEENYNSLMNENNFYLERGESDIVTNNDFSEAPEFKSFTNRNLNNNNKNNNVNKLANSPIKENKKSKSKSKKQFQNRNISISNNLSKFSNSKKKNNNNNKSNKKNLKIFINPLYDFKPNTNKVFNSNNLIKRENNNFYNCTTNNTINNNKFNSNSNNKNNDNSQSLLSSPVKELAKRSLLQKTPDKYNNANISNNSNKNNPVDSMSSLPYNEENRHNMTTNINENLNKHNVSHDNFIQANNYSSLTGKSNKEVKNPNYDFYGNNKSEEGLFCLKNKALTPIADRNINFANKNFYSNIYYDLSTTNNQILSNKNSINIKKFDYVFGDANNSTTNKSSFAKLSTEVFNNTNPSFPISKQEMNNKGVNNTDVLNSNSNSKSNNYGHNFSSQNKINNLQSSNSILLNNSNVSKSYYSGTVQKNFISNSFAKRIPIELDGDITNLKGMIKKF